MKKAILIIAGTLCLAACAPKAAEYTEPDHQNITCFEDMQAYFTYNPARDIVISSHRGGMMPGFPENCSASCENTLSLIPTFFEVDFSFTKDSVLVMMHDFTLDRTTTGKGWIRDYTYEELQQFNLVDRDENVTPYKIPTLNEMLAWSKGKAILNFDNKYISDKDTSPEDKLGCLEYYAKQLLPGGDWADYPNIMITVRSLDEALFYWNRGIHDVMFSAEITSPEIYEAFDASPIPWDHFLAYVHQTLNPDMYEVYNKLHEQGVMLMIAVSPTSDTVRNPTDRRAAYLQNLISEPDVIETDYPAEFVDLPRSRKALRDLQATYRK
ncbi:MAG: glycerophosphodiester phosphodiesterase family protein [Clostridia bacterium]|nr:glycerophosphodiester phosphodiesterase family protein [Clostridia bacterium]